MRITIILKGSARTCNYQPQLTCNATPCWYSQSITLRLTQSYGCQVLLAIQLDSHMSASGLLSEARPEGGEEEGGAEMSDQ